MNLLAIETSSVTSSVALLDGGRVIASRAFPSATSLCRDLVGHLQAMLAYLPDPVHLEAVAVSLGPGSFTSLRVGVVTAKALAHRWRLPLAGVPTLEALAHPWAGQPGRVIGVGQPAWKSSVYVAAYEATTNGGLAEVRPVSAIEVDALPDYLASLPGNLVITGEVLRERRAELAAKAPANAELAPDALCAPQAAFVAGAAWARLDGLDLSAVHRLRPIYVVASQAERAAGIDLGLA